MKQQNSLGWREQSWHGQPVTAGQTNTLLGQRRGTFGPRVPQVGHRTAATPEM